MSLRLRMSLRRERRPCTWTRWLPRPLLTRRRRQRTPRSGCTIRCRPLRRDAGRSVRLGRNRPVVLGFVVGGTHVHFSKCRRDTLRRILDSVLGQVVDDSVVRSCAAVYTVGYVDVTSSGVRSLARGASTRTRRSATGPLRCGLRTENVRLHEVVPAAASAHLDHVDGEFLLAGCQAGQLFGSTRGTGNRPEFVAEDPRNNSQLLPAADRAHHVAAPAVELCGS